jgi:hypothetical protein
MTTYDDSLDDIFEGLNEGYVPGEGVEARERFPFAQVHNAKEARGVGGGLFFKTRENAPKDLVIQDENGVGFKPITIVFDNQQGEIEEPGFIASQYHLGIIGCSVDENGRPNVYKDARNNVWTFNVLCVIKEAFSNTTPIKISYKGTNAFRMQNAVRSFDNFVVGTATKLRKERNPNADPACRHQFWLPIKHEREQVGQGETKSWACPIQDLVKETVRITTEPKYTRTGLSVLKRYTEPENITDLGKLAIYHGKNDQEGLALVQKLAKWVVEYKDVLKAFESYVPRAASGSSFERRDFGQGSMPHFADSPNQLATEKQQNFLLRLCKDNSVDWYEELQFLVGANKLANLPEAYDSLKPEELFGLLSKSGMSVLIDQVKTTAGLDDNGSRPAPTPELSSTPPVSRSQTSRFAAQAGAAINAAPSSVEDVFDSDIPF